MRVSSSDMLTSEPTRTGAKGSDGDQASYLPLRFLQQTPESLVSQHPLWEVSLTSELGVLQALPQLTKGTDLLVQLPLPSSRCLEVQLQVQGGAGHELSQG